MPLLERLGALARKDLAEERVAVRQRHHEVGCLGCLTTQHHPSFAEVNLGLCRPVRRRHEHLGAGPLPLPYGILDDGQLPFAIVLVAQAFKDAFGRMPLLLRSLAVLLENLVNDRKKRPQLRLRPGLLQPVAWWFLVR